MSICLSVCLSLYAYVFLYVHVSVCLSLYTTSYNLSYMGGPDLILSPHPGGLSCRGPSRPRLCPELRPQCWSRSYRGLGLLLQVSVICMLSVYLKLTDCLRPPSMRSLELLSYPAYYMPPLHGVASPQAHSPGLLQN